MEEEGVKVDLLTDRAAGVAIAAGDVELGVSRLVAGVRVTDAFEAIAIGVVAFGAEESRVRGVAVAGGGMMVEVSMTFACVEEIDCVGLAALAVVGERVELVDGVAWVRLEAELEGFGLSRVDAVGEVENDGTLLAVFVRGNGMVAFSDGLLPSIVIAVPGEMRFASLTPFPSSATPTPRIELPSFAGCCLRPPVTVTGSTPLATLMMLSSSC